MRKDVRLLALGVTAAAVLGLGALFYAGAAVRSSPAGDFDARFRSAALLLQARKYERAAAELQRLLQAAPRVPELHVNMGYAMLGLKKPAAARDFFSAAIDLRPGQANAYYGLAEALEALGDLPGALGAMRSFVHLSAPGDPFVRKANAAIWEWQAAQTKR